MSDTRAAAERIVSAPTIYTGHYPREQDGYWGGDPDDAVKVAKAYLELVPADDGEPITREWLVSIGFSRNWDSMRFFIADELSVWYSETGRIELVDTPLQNIKSRGDLRRLLAALGVTQ